MATGACPCECCGVALQSELAWSTCEHCSEKRQIFARHSRHPHKANEAIKRSIRHMKNHRQRAHADLKVKRQKTTEDDSEDDGTAAVPSAALSAALNAVIAVARCVCTRVLRLQSAPPFASVSEPIAVTTATAATTAVAATAITLAIGRRCGRLIVCWSCCFTIRTASAGVEWTPRCCWRRRRSVRQYSCRARPLDDSGPEAVCGRRHRHVRFASASVGDDCRPSGSVRSRFTARAVYARVHTALSDHFGLLHRSDAHRGAETGRPQHSASNAEAADEGRCRQLWSFDNTVFANGSVTARNAALDRLRLPVTAKPATTFGSVAGIVNESAAKALFVSNLDAQSVAGNHNDLFPDLFKSVQDEAKEVQSLVQRAVDAAFREYTARRASDESVALRRWRRPLEISWDKICAEQLYPLGGFGLTGIQVYIKRVLALTLFHTELCYSSAMNLMRHNSMGAAIWVGFFFQDLLKHYTAEEARKMMRCDESSFIAVVRKWQADGVRLWYCIQTPGSAVYSPSSVRGAGHVVFTLGPNIVQTAWNAGVSLAAFRECLSHHRECERSTDNGGDTTRFTVPCLRLQALGLQLGLEEELAEVKGLIAFAIRQPQHPRGREQPRLPNQMHGLWPSHRFGGHRGSLHRLLSKLATCRFWPKQQHRERRNQPGCHEGRCGRRCRGSRKGFEIA